MGSWPSVTKQTVSGSKPLELNSALNLWITQGNLLRGNVNCSGLLQLCSLSLLDGTGQHSDHLVSCVLLRREHAVPYLVTVLLSILLNNLPMDDGGQG